MPLEFGFGRYQGNEAAWQKIYDNLDANDKAFAHNHLAYILMFTDIRAVTEKSIPHIVERLSYFSPDLYYDINEQLHKQNITFPEYLKRYIGFSANVRTSTTKEFIKKITEALKRRLPNLLEKDITDIEQIPDVSTLGVSND